MMAQHSAVQSASQQLKETDMTEDDEYSAKALVRQQAIDDDPSLLQNTFFSIEANAHRLGWVPPSASEARILADKKAWIHKPLMPYKTTQASRRYRPQLTKDVVMRVLGLDSEQYLNLRGTVRTVVRAHGLDKPDGKGETHQMI